MASFHLAVQIIKRSKRGNAVAAAAYRAGAQLTDERTGLVHDYSHRRGVVHSEIMLPPTAARWLGDRTKLWNHVEKMEHRYDAQLAREMNLALPVELSVEDRLALVRDFIRTNFTREGMVADFAIHEPVMENGDDPRNHHAHIMLTLRGATGKGLWRVKTREWNGKDRINEWRESWAEMQNRALGRRCRPERVDHRTLKEQFYSAMNRGDPAAAELLDRLPEIHIGRAAKALERKQRVAASKARTVQTYAGNEQVRDYPKTDRGSRLDEVVRRLTVNLDKMDRKVTKWGRQAARFRQKRQSYDREEYAVQRAAERAEAREAAQREREAQRAQDRVDWAAAQRRRRQTRASLGLNPTAGQPAKYRWSPHKARRRDLAGRLVNDLDTVIAMFTGLQSKTLKRRRVLTGQLLNQGRARRSRRGGRVRKPATHPKGPPSIFP